MAHLKCDFQNYAILHSDLTRKKIQCNFGATTDLLRTCLRCRRASRRSLLYDGVDEGRAVEEHSLVALKRPQKWALIANDWLKS